jgi:hypothetical protein
MIISERSALPKAFRMKGFNLLWRSDRDSFITKEFHCHGCSARAD